MPMENQLLTASLQTLRGVGNERAAQLGRLGLHSVGDLLLHRPRRYEDRRHWVTIAQLEPGQPALTRGRIVAQGNKRFGRGKTLFECVLEDGTARLHCRWWNLPYMDRYFAVGDELVVYGKIASLKPRTMDHPETETIETGETSIHLDRIVPVYPLTEGLSQRWLRSLIWRTLGEHGPRLREPWPELHPELTHRPDCPRAIQHLHFPAELSDAAAARERLALDEFIVLQLELQKRRRKFMEQARAFPCPGDNRLIKPFLARLGFTLTAAQTRVLRDCRRELGSPHPMRRLLQGDVGAGKTVVAACCALMVIESGRNVALMAPTEILAEQHFQTFRTWFGELGIPVSLQTASFKDSLPAEAAEPGSNRPGGLVIGTHALIQPGLALPDLGLVIIDEQHKFGVAERESLVRKGHFPHLLVMTATPIPRTLGLTLYGDLDVSVIDELPQGRGVIRTFVRGQSQLPKVYQFIREQLAAGRQAYLVLPRVEESDVAAGLKAVKQEFANLEKEFAGFKVGLLHGRLTGPAKEAVMNDFRQNRLQLLVATTVVEVGLDVPNATVLLVEGAEQFGLAQLHQLRGRIGRGAHESFCILVANLRSPEARQRLRVLEQTSDGFAIAESDLRLRGPGELLGAAQHGVPRFRFGDLLEDTGLILEAKRLAGLLLDRRKGAKDGSISHSPNYLFGQ